MTPLRSADLRHLISIVRPTQTEDGKGGYTETYSVIANCWAEVRAETGKEKVMEEVLQGIAIYRIRIRWRDDIRTSDQITYAGSEKPLNIRAVDDPDGKREQLVIVADTASVRTD